MHEKIQAGERGREEGGMGFCFHKAAKEATFKQP